ncbi:GNAT family N-acetyltransferase [Chelativorans sp.]|uniref:GNAT family N-acetyltransferase n=1 Tax=Chelativorans sp. TaxID=2203393 RepID=UPI002811FB27|nr:GNAT family N-acetyltransferase [Chelativorans sp.]
MTGDLRGYELRPSTAADRDAIAHVWHASASLPRVGPPDIPTVEELRTRIDLELAAGWSITVAVRDGDVIGFVAIKPQAPVLDQLFVRPGYLGIGVGRALLEHAMAAMPDGFTLHTRSGNWRARRFYEKAGLTFLREDVHPRTGDPVSHYGWKIR